ncbi:hypothetical protein H7F50_05895 [Novosphingobium flavum]|uniref:Uncharacterized protein n=1 Tax=Novosphingobium aerophilum TaxID=2839843 RepID=A0A7X1F6H3_9SPHN|nr:hypothetical protein [Novosphingobium aerophilum]MBC2651253.1 hypothetical protein [Novosphingobium aerophilum]MBC2661281.1 hypothetical protein [Novosphingobium aerophilum]
MLNAAVYATDGTDEAEVQLIYGTTQLKLMQRRNDFFVTNAAEMDSCGLHKATRFDLDKVAWIPWASEWFDCLTGYSSPIIGHLSQHSTKLLQYQLGRRQALRQQSLDGI